MKAIANFTPGPSQLYFTVQDHMRAAFREGIPSISHRSKIFENIYAEAAAGLRELLGAPADYHIFFTGSATEIWERAAQNLTEKKSLHLVNGSFSSRFHEIALQCGKQAVKIESTEGAGFDFPSIASDTEMIALTHNETSTGVSLPMAFINRFREAAPDSLIVVDAVSSLPFPKFDFTKIDSVFFSVQKGFGLPAGLGVWIVNDRCIEKAKQVSAAGLSIGSYHNLVSLHANAKKNQTPETPNVLGIYLLNAVVKDFLQRGVEALRRETEYKAALLYHTLSKHGLFEPFVKDKDLQSKTVIVANTGEHTSAVTEFLGKHGLQPGDGYGKNKATQLRFANFPAHSKEVFEQLSDALEKYQG